MDLLIGIWTTNVPSVGVYSTVREKRVHMIGLCTLNFKKGLNNSLKLSNKQLSIEISDKKSKLEGLAAREEHKGMVTAGKVEDNDV
uniref:Uncharacterized protein n=1 Tax=Oryza brachyantha TaxID=4533 RepID=J3MGH7_ORYBR